MVEQPKKSGWFRCLFRGILVVVKWLFITAFAILFVGGLFFHGPPKILLLIGIFLAEMTILPKRFRKWFWCGFGAVILILIIWVFLPDNNEGWKPYTLDDEIAQLEAKYAVADEENAALIYNRLIDTYDPNDTDTEFIDDDTDFITSSQPWSSKNYPQLAKWLKTHEQTIAILTEAAAKEKSYFPFSTNNEDFGKMMDRLSPMKHWAELLVFAANNDIGDGRSEDALEKNLVLFQIGQHLYQQSMLIELLVGMAVDGLSTKQFNIFIVDGNPTEPQLDLIDKKIAESEYNWSVDFHRILEGETLYSKNMLLGIFYEVDSDGNTRFSRDPTATIRNQLIYCPPSERNLLPGYLRKKTFKACTIFAWLWLPMNPQNAAKIIDESKKDLYVITEDGFDDKKDSEPFSYWSIRPNFRGIIKTLDSILTPSYRLIHEFYLRAASSNQATRIIIALKRYEKVNGIWPNSLENIENEANEKIFVDPINDSDYVYKLTDENFTLYSSGQNKIDEDGDRRTNKPDGTMTDDMLYWPKRQRKRQMLMPGTPK